MAPDSTDPNVTENTEDQTSSASSGRGGPFSGPLGVLVFVVLFAGAGFLTYRTLCTADIAEPEPVPRVFKCVETDEVFGYALKEGEHWPVMSKFSGKKTAYPAEACYWTKDGKQKRKPDYIILNEYLGKPGDTFCPVCGRLVVGHNPTPPPETPYVDASEEDPAAVSPEALAEPEKAGSPESPEKASPESEKPSDGATGEATEGAVPVAQPSVH